MKVHFDYPDYILPECNLLPSFSKHFNLFVSGIENDSKENFKITLQNKSFCDCLRIVKNNGIVYFTILNNNYNIVYNGKYI